MTPEELTAFLKEDFDKRLEVIIRKNKDYATEDALSNFKRRAEIFRVLRLDKIITTPTGVALADTILKIDRIINLLIKGTEAQNEPLEESFGDFENYGGLAHANYEETKKE